MRGKQHKRPAQTDARKLPDKERLARKILGVEDNADAVAVKKAFWLLAMTYHPDKRPGDPEALKRFANLVNAYEFLTKGEAKGWDPGVENAADEARIGEYLANEWGYFCWWNENFGAQAKETKQREDIHKPRKDRSRTKRQD